MNEDGKISKEEFEKGVRQLGLAMVKQQVDAIFDSLDHEGTVTDANERFMCCEYCIQPHRVCILPLRAGVGKIAFSELKRELRRDTKAEDAEQKARKEAERKAREEAARVEVVDVGLLRRAVASKLKVEVGSRRTAAFESANAPIPMEEVSSFPDPAVAPMPGASLTFAAVSAKSNAMDVDRLHLHLRLRGTELPTTPLSAPPPFANATIPDRTVTRHGKRPTLERGRHDRLPRLIDVLSVHRLRSHVPARRHCRVLLPPVPAKLTSEQQLQLQQSLIAKHGVDKHRGLRLVQSVPTLLLRQPRSVV